MFTLSDNHELQLEFNGDWEAFVYPIVGRECFFNVDFDDKTGLFEFKVAYSSGYYDNARYIEYWLNECCDKFLFDDNYYGDIKSLSLAMWKHELKVAANDERAIEDVLECVGQFADEIQVELLIGAMS